MAMDLSKYQRRRVVLVDDNGNESGVAELIEAHREPGMRHKAFSLWLYRKKDGRVEVLLQKRSRKKPLFRSLWANSCCYNLAPNEELLDRVKTRVMEELGLELGEVELRKVYEFEYYASDVGGWCERELDQVVVGECDDKLSEARLNPDEVDECRWMNWEDLKRDVVDNSKQYAPWLKIMVSDGRVEEAMK